MGENEKIKNFADMVEATRKLTRPWIIALIVTNVLWMLIVGMLVWFAYMTPTEMTQEQDLTNQHQSQSYTEGATNGS